MLEIVPDEYLRFALFDAVRGVRLTALKRCLTDDERKLVADAIHARIKLSHWQVICDRNYRSAHSRTDGKD